MCCIQNKYRHAIQTLFFFPGPCMGVAIYQSSRLPSLRTSCIFIPFKICLALRTEAKQNEKEKVQLVHKSEPTLPDRFGVFYGSNCWQNTYSFSSVVSSSMEIKSGDAYLELVGRVFLRWCSSGNGNRRSPPRVASIATISDRNRPNRTKSERKGRAITSDSLMKHLAFQCANAAQ